MAKLIRVYDPDEKERRINLVLPEAVCPGLLEFMAEVPYGNDTPLIRGVFYQWFLKHRDAGTLDEALNEALSGPGGLVALHANRMTQQPSARSKKRVPKQRSVTAKPGLPPATSPPHRQQDAAQKMSNELVVSPPVHEQGQDPGLSTRGLAAVEAIEEKAPDPAPPLPGNGHLSDSLVQPTTEHVELIPDADQLDALNLMGSI